MLSSLLGRNSALERLRGNAATFQADFLFLPRQPAVAMTKSILQQRANTLTTTYGRHDFYVQIINSLTILSKDVNLKNNIIAGFDSWQWHLNN